MLTTTGTTAPPDLSLVPDRASTTSEVDGVTLKWFSRSPRPSDAPPRRKGFETAMVLAEAENGRHVGHLTCTWADPALVSSQFRRPALWYANSLTGFRGDDRELWLLLARQGRLAAWLPTPVERLRAGDVPSDDVVEEHLANTDFVVTPRMREWEAFHAVPYPGVVCVTPSWQRHGVATDMYVAAARMLAAAGSLLRASGDCSGEAERVWQRLARTTEVTTVTVPDPANPGDTASFPAVDLRGSEEGW